VKALRDRTPLRRDLQYFFELCDGVIPALMSNRIDCATAEDALRRASMPYSDM
jgi:hypothetical protein